jgi:hypothetical protein
VTKRRRIGRGAVGDATVGAFKSKVAARVRRSKQFCPALSVPYTPVLAADPRQVTTMASPSQHRSIEVLLLTLFIALIIWAILTTR